MIITLKKGTTENQMNEFIGAWKEKGFDIHVSKGENLTILGLLGDTSSIDTEQVEAFEVVDRAKRISAPYKMASRSFHPENTIIKVGEATFGNGMIPVIAGPCSVETEEQVISIAKDVKKAGARLLRGGAFKPRTSPYSFQGLGEQGLEILKTAKKETGLPIVTELMDIRQLQYFDDVDVIQIGARNMQNFSLLSELGKTKKPIILKRGFGNTLDEWLRAAEYIVAQGNPNIILCERGIKTFENSTRNTLDISSVALIKEYLNVPVIIDPSHSAGRADIIPALSKAGIAVGADGLIIEVHHNPKKSISDSQQALDYETFIKLINNI